MADASHAVIFLFPFAGRVPHTMLTQKVRCYWGACFESKRWKYLCFCCHNVECRKLQLKQLTALNVRMCSDRRPTIVIMFRHDLARQNKYSNSENVRNAWNLCSLLHADAIVKRVASSTRNRRLQGVHETGIRSVKKRSVLKRNITFL